MSQVVTKRVVFYSTGTSEYPYVTRNNNEEDALLKTETLSSGVNKVIELDADTSQGSEIVLNVQSDEEPMASKTFVKTKTSRHVIRTHVTETGEQKQFTTQTTPVLTTTIKLEKHDKNVQKDTDIQPQYETELRCHHREPNDQQAFPKIEMQSQMFLPMKTNLTQRTATNEKVKETNSRSTNASKTSTQSTSIKSCYTYRVKDGVAILENVTNYQSKKQTKRERSQPQQTNPSTDYQQMDKKDTEQSTLTKMQPLEKTFRAVRVEEKNENGQGSQEREICTWSTVEKEIPHKKKDNDDNLRRKIKFTSVKNTQQDELQEANTSRQCQNISEVTNAKRLQHNPTSEALHKQNTNQKTKIDPSPPGRLLSPDYAQHTQPLKTFEASSPGRLVIPDFNQHTTTIEVKELTPPPTKVDKHKTEEWITQVATQKEVRSQPPLQANRLSADKVQFLHSQDTQPVKKLDASSPGRLVIPDFNQHTSTIEVKELTPPPTKVEKRKPEEWITQVVTQEEVRSEPPLQANRLSADKVQFLHSQDTQPVKKLDASSPGRLVIPDFNQHTSTIEVKELTPPPTKVEKRKPEEWITQVAAIQKSTGQVGTNKFSSDMVYTEDAVPANTRFPGKLVVHDCKEMNAKKDVTEGIQLSQGSRANVDVWITQANKYGKERSELPSLIGKVSEDKVKYIHRQDMEPALSPLQHDNRVTSEGNHHHQNVSFEVQDISLSGKDQKPTLGQWSTTRRTQVRRSEEPAARKSRCADAVEYSHSQKGQRAERFENVSLGEIVIPDSKQHSFSVNILQHSHGLETEKPNSQQWITQNRTHGTTPSKSTHGSSGKGQAYFTYTEPATGLDGSTPGGLIILDIHDSQGNSSSQIQEVVPPPIVKQNNNEQWTTQIITHEGLQSKGPRTIQILDNHNGQSMTTSDNVSSATGTVVPGFQHSFSIQTQDGKHIGEELIQRKSTTKLRAGELQFVNSGEGQQVITLDGPSDGTIVIPIQIENVSSFGNIKIRNA